MKSSFLFVLLLSAFALTVSAQCGRTCRFRFCRADGSDPPSLRPKGARILLRGPDSSRTGFICRSFPNGRTLGTIKRTGAAILENKGNVAINRWRPTGLSPRFPRNHFRLYNIPLQLDESAWDGVPAAGTKRTSSTIFACVCPSPTTTSSTTTAPCSARLHRRTRGIASRSERSTGRCSWKWRGILPTTSTSPWKDRRGLMGSESTTIWWPRAVARPPGRKL
ncbi:Gal-2,6-Sulfurylases II [Chondrus crispus]|uniref:Gal-2,6-Sulfurylases II n=1 Tax=Chondrus crispus TaxID=2769 RepID=R7QPQ3_CHOCR|nr:Gal-2,6-Sulfurylases II [Chondrus crispus]CDF40074.1 Gal-2,6-Sulfurylases II [Chondrus crispus]|eukprot:XP_005710368.1 Gal-2,6-Sulfurylases II [Chondrus crispus]